jgi:hypothetical protein
MTDLAKLSPSALSAAMRGGTDQWGQWGSSRDHVRYLEPKPVSGKGWRKCYCGCGKRATHRGMANGICLAHGCHLSMMRWVKTGR